MGGEPTIAVKQRQSDANTSWKSWIEWVKQIHQGISENEIYKDLIRIICCLILIRIFSLGSSVMFDDWQFESYSYTITPANEWVKENEKIFESKYARLESPAVLLLQLYKMLHHQNEKFLEDLTRDDLSLQQHAILAARYSNVISSSASLMARAASEYTRLMTECEPPNHEWDELYAICDLELLKKSARTFQMELEMHMRVHNDTSVISNTLNEHNNLDVPMNRRIDWVIAEMKANRKKVPINGTVSF